MPKCARGSQFLRIASLICSGHFRNDPAVTAERHIRLLHEYNEIKDVGQGLMGMIADTKGVRVVEIHKEYGVSEKD